MNEAKHTKGPWEARQIDDVYGVTGWHICGGWDLVYRAALVQNANDSPQNEANAQLIAASPTLLEAAKAALLVLSGEHDTDSARQEAESGLRAAIAKALGEPSHG